MEMDSLKFRLIRRLSILLLSIFYLLTVIGILFLNWSY